MQVASSITQSDCTPPPPEVELLAHLHLPNTSLSTPQRDRITSFRKTGTKKEKPLIQHPTDPQSAQTEMPVPQPLFDERSMNLSEKEIVDLFEKMMVSQLPACRG